MNSNSEIDSKLPSTSLFGHSNAEHKPAQSTSEIRTDIQALRGWAVLTVVFYHAKLPFFPAGYLGVDVFFVISGYLITAIISRQCAERSFKLAEFYLKRAKRLLPASYVVLLSVILVTPWLLNQSDILDFKKQVLGAVTSTTNIILWMQAGYFSTSVAFKPLLHLWSLAIEQQFYLLLPLFMLAVPSRWWLPALTGAVIVSLAACVWRSGNDSTFYLLPTRAWELLLGSAASLLPNGPARGRLSQFRWIPWIVCLTLPLNAWPVRHPGWPALLICIATTWIVLAGGPTTTHRKVAAWLARLGDLSYALYLVHWPLLSAFYNIWSGELASRESLEWRLGLVLLSLISAVGLNRFIEAPVRRMAIVEAWRWWAALFASSAVLAIFALLWIPAASAKRDYGAIRAANNGFGKDCAFEGNFEFLASCRNGSQPEVLLWGDSFAMHLVPGLNEGNPDNPRLVQATKYICGPMLNLAVYRPQAGKDRKWGEGCIAFNASVLGFLSNRPDIKIVVLSSPFDQYLGLNEHVLFRAADDAPWTIVPATSDIAKKSLKSSVFAIREMGKKVVIVAPPPMGGFDIGRCLERRERGLPILNAPPECRIERSEYTRQRHEVLDFLNRAEAELDVSVIKFDEVTCGPSYCDTKIGDTFIYRDDGHFTVEGSVYMADRAKLWEKIRKYAR